LEERARLTREGVVPLAAAASGGGIGYGRVPQRNRESVEVTPGAGKLDSPLDPKLPLLRQTRRRRLQSGEHGWLGDLAHMDHLLEPLNGGDSIWLVTHAVHLDCGAPGQLPPR